MSGSKRDFLVIENSGHEGEQEVSRHKEYVDAVAYCKKTYSTSEIDSLHVVICIERDGQRSYEI
jgi:hypothetical protein